MLRVTKNISEADFITHAGNFHADDVFATAFLEKLYDNITVIRLKEYKSDGTKLAYDIGDGPFDHHTLNKKARKNGTHYCSFGLLWQSLGKKYLEKINVPDIDTTFKVFDYLLVNSIDAIDNGEFAIESSYNIYQIDDLIALFRPHEEEDEDECFKEAVNFASLIFDKVLKDALTKADAIKIIKAKIPTIKNKVLILDKFVPFDFACFYLNLDVNFVVYPSNRGCYAAKTISTHYKGFTPKVSFNKSWAGLRDDALAKISGVKTARFCHPNLFLVTADTLEDTLKLVSLSSKN